MFILIKSISAQLKTKRIIYLFGDYVQRYNVSIVVVVVVEHKKSELNNLIDRA